MSMHEKTKRTKKSVDTEEDRADMEVRANMAEDKDLKLD